MQVRKAFLELFRLFCLFCLKTLSRPVIGCLGVVSRLSPTAVSIRVVAEKLSGTLLAHLVSRKYPMTLCVVGASVWISSAFERIGLRAYFLYWPTPRKAGMGSAKAARQCKLSA